MSSDQGNTIHASRKTNINTNLVLNVIRNSSFCYFTHTFAKCFIGTKNKSCTIKTRAKTNSMFKEYGNKKISKRCTYIV